MSMSKLILSIPAPSFSPGFKLVSRLYLNVNMQDAITQVTYSCFQPLVVRATHGEEQARYESWKFPTKVFLVISQNVIIWVCKMGSKDSIADGWLE